MEKSTILARLAIFSFVCCFLFPMTSCTHDDQEEELYVIEAKAKVNTQTTASKTADTKEEDEKKEEDFVDKTKIILKKKKKKTKK